MKFKYLIIPAVFALFGSCVKQVPITTMASESLNKSHAEEIKLSLDLVKNKISENDWNSFVKECVNVPLIQKGDLDQDPISKLEDANEIKSSLKFFFSEFVYYKSRDGSVKGLKRSDLIRYLNYPDYEKKERISEFIWCDMKFVWDPSINRFMIKEIYKND